MLVPLTPLENRIIKLLLNCIHDKQLPATLRIAGGWVRDKLLRIESHDLDIVVDKMNGLDFASVLTDYSKSKKLEIGSIGRIKPNPDKSKHLETATLTLFGTDVDFVGLRHEIEYTPESRNPAVVIGTPEQDAFRRDITINSLFYNIHSQEIEDFTGKGLKDLESGIIRTPMPAFKTFSDDPLRILRVIRFATRFNFKLDEEIRDAVKFSEIKDAFSKKITKERIGVELEKMLTGADPVGAIRILVEFGYYDAVFEYPSDYKETKFQDPKSVLQLTSIINSILHKSKILLEWPIEKLGIQFPLDKELEKRLYLACCISPFLGMTTQTSKSKNILLGKWMILNSIKLGNYDADQSSTMVEMSDLIQKWVNREIEYTPEYRRDLGLFIRNLGNIKSLGDHWPFGIFFAMILEIKQASSGIYFQEIDFQDSKISEISSKYKNFMDGIVKLSLERIHLEKHLLDGKVVLKALNLRPGPSIGENLDKVMAWQLENPDGKPNDCLEWLVSSSQTVNK